MTDPADLRDLKNATRVSAKVLRAEAAAAAGAEASEAVSRRVAGLLAGMPRPAVVAGYWPIGSELEYVDASTVAQALRDRRSVD